MENLFLGIFMTLAGLFAIVFHKKLRSRSEDWNDRAPWYLRSSPRGGPLFSITVIVLGSISIYAGIRFILMSVLGV